MRASVWLGLAAFLFCGVLAASAEEGRKEEPKKENPLPESVRGFAGQVKGIVAAKVEGGIDLKVTEVLKTWEANKAAQPKALVGMTIRVISPWVKVGDKMQQAKTRLAYLSTLQVGQEVTLEIKNTEREVFIVTELTKEQKEQAEAAKAKKPEGEKKPEGGEKKPEPPKGDGEF